MSEDGFYEIPAEHLLESEVTYKSLSAPFLTIDGPDGWKDGNGNNAIKFQNHVYRTKDARVVKFFDWCIRTKPAISALVSKTDYAAAEKLAREHQELMKSQNGTLTGPTSTMDARREAAVKAEIANRDFQIKEALKANPEAVQEQLKGVELTVGSEGQITRNSELSPVNDPAHPAVRHGGAVLPKDAAPLVQPAAGSTAADTIVEGREKDDTVRTALGNLLQGKGTNS